MSTLRISNIEAKADASSPTINEKLKFTSSPSVGQDPLLHLDGLNAASGITTIGINTTSNTITARGNDLEIAGITTFTGAVTASSTLTVAGNLDIADTIYHTGDSNTKIRFPAADTFTAETGGSERLRITSRGAEVVGICSISNPFFINAQTVDDNYTIPTGKNAGTFGPVTVASNKTVTIPSGSYWTIV